jgi:hypothetical protein
MGQIEIPVTISKRRCDQCDSDLKIVCESIAFQNSAGNLLVDSEIKENQIILKYEEYDCQKI